MPTETFFNLPEHKRKRVIDAAVEEFGAHPFHHASLSRIVDRAGISKGSIYQYFRDKRDLHQFIVALSVRRKRAAGKRARSTLPPDADLFDRMRVSVDAGIEFARRHPALAAVGRNLLRETDPEIVRSTRGCFRRGRNELLTQWLEEAARLGELDEDLDLAACRWALAVFVDAMTDRVVGDPSSPEETTQLASDILDILEHGMRPRAERGR